MRETFAAAAFRTRCVLPWMLFWLYSSRLQVAKAETGLRGAVASLPDTSHVEAMGGSDRGLASFVEATTALPSAGPSKGISEFPLLYSVPIIIGLVALSGLFSGLTLGLMGLDMNGLEIVKRGDNKELAACAEKIAPLRKRGNQLLCTLLLGNVAVNSALSILTAELADGLVGFLVSTGLIVVFGEILPQAACSRYALRVGACTVPMVRILMGMFYVFTRPMSACLDWLLGREAGTLYSHVELMEMLKLQISLGAINEAEGEVAKQVAEGALSFRDKRASEVMTPLEDAYMLHTDTRLGYDAIREIFETGFTRIPVYGKDRNDYKGLLYTKDLMLADPEDEMRVGDFIAIFHRKVETIFPDTKLINILNAFKKGGTHMALVRKVNTEVDTDPRFEICGVLTLEDIVEEILQDEIVDETDVFVDVDHQVKVADGREQRCPNLAIFNPVWKQRSERLSKEEVSAIAHHLERKIFVTGSPLELSERAVEWLVITCGVQSRQRCTALGVMEPDPKDFLYRAGRTTERLTLVLQGRVALTVGKESIPAEVGAFSLLGLDALLPGRTFVCDFNAHVGTPRVRLLFINRDRFLQAKALDADPEALDNALRILTAEAAGESSRQEARELRHLSNMGCGSPMSLAALGGDEDKGDCVSPGASPFLSAHELTRL